MSARLAPRITAAVRGSLALIGEAVLQRSRDVRGSVAVVSVIAGIFMRQIDVPGVVVIVVPLGAVMSCGRFFVRIEQACPVVVVFQNQVNETAACRRQRTGSLADRR